MLKRILSLLCCLNLLLCIPAAAEQSEEPAVPMIETADTAAEESTNPENPGEAAQATAVSDISVLLMEYGSSGEDVESLQQRMTDLGYYTGKISGNYLEGTEKAVKKFQKDYELPETGKVDTDTMLLLISAEYRVLDTESNGQDVTRLQQELKKMGYLSANATGKYRAATAAAVKEFQEHNGLEATGIADQDTQRLLFGGRALAKGVKPTPTPGPDEDLGDINDVVMAGDGEAAPLEWSRKYERGSKGEEVKLIQNRLTDLGFFDGPISGNYMNQTVAAVKSFQGMNGLRTDGVCGEATWNMLFNSDEVLNVNCTPRPTPEPTPIPYAITVDVRNQVTTVYGRDENGGYTIPVRRMVCSTGMKATPSDVGEWVLNGRHARWCYFGKFNSHAQYWTQINDYIAFHSVIYNQVDYNALSVKSYNKLGSRASHGCVRLLVSDSKWIYENIGEGTVVTITEELPDDEELRRSVAAPPLNGSRTGPVTTPEPTPEPEYRSDSMPPQPFRKLKRGSEGEDVYWLQCRLKELGYYTGTVTGGYYKGTEKAVKAFQKDHRISASGTADERTLKAVYADILEAHANTPEPTTEPEMTLTPEVTPAPAE